MHIEKRGHPDLDILTRNTLPCVFIIVKGRSAHVTSYMPIIVKKNKKEIGCGNESNYLTIDTKNALEL